MKSKERVLATLEGKPVDRVASDFRAEPEVLERLRLHLNLPDAEAVRAWAKSDFRDLGFICNTGGYGGYNSFGWKDKVLPDGRLEDLWGVHRAMVDYGDGAYIDIVNFPLRDMQGIDEIRKYQFPDPAKIFDFTDLPSFVDKTNREGNDEFFFIIEGESLFDRCWALRGIEAWMMDLLADPDVAEHLLENNYRFFYNYTRMLLEGAKGKVDAIGIYNDLGNQRGMMISPDLYRQYCKGRQREYIKMVHGFGVKVFYHSCGGITDILEDMIDIGVDILDPLQLVAMQLTPEELITRMGDRITLHGGLDTQTLLVNGSPQEIAKEARHLKSVLGRHGKYIYSCSHLVQMDVPVRNIEALVKEVS